MPVVLGSTREVTLRLVARNTGEPAFLARVAVTLPQPLSVARMPAACHAPQGAPAPARTSKSRAAGAPTSLLCDVANPLGHNRQVGHP